MQVTSKDPLEYARETVGKDPVAIHLGLKVAELAEAHAVISLVPAAQHLNAVDRVHGSTLYALADQALAVAANTMGSRALVVECKINFLSAALPEKELRATAKPIKLGRKLCLWEVNITDPDQRLVAVAQGLTFHQQAGG